MDVSTKDLYELIKYCQKFDDSLAGSEESKMISDMLKIERITYRILSNGLTTTSQVIYKGSDGKIGENYDYTANTSTTKIVILRIHRANGVPELDDEEKILMDTFAEIIISGICVKHLITAYENIVYHDIQTGITNYNYFKTHATKVLRTSNNNDYTVGYINIKNCKVLNRIFGSDITNQLIVDFSRKSLEQFDINKGELLSRLGGDNFIFIVQNDNLDNILKFFSGVPVSYETHNDIIEYTIHVRAGLIMVKNSPSSDIGFLTNAVASSIAMAKQPGAPDFMFYSDNVESVSIGQQEFINEIKKDLEEEKFLVYFQPIVKIADGHTNMVGAEALIRWRKSDRMVNPMSFIPVAEKYNFINKIDMYVLNKVCAKLKEWTDKGYDVVPISCNFSQNDLLTPDLPDNIIKTIDSYGIPHKLINIEFTEAGFHEEYEALFYSATKLISEGVKVSVDNFGTGYSSLNLLRNLNFDYLKLDMTLLNAPDAKAGIIVDTIIDLAQKLGLTVICEGINSKEDVERAIRNGCTLFQAEFYEKALSERYFLNRLKNPVF